MQENNNENKKTLNENDVNDIMQNSENTETNDTEETDDGSQIFYSDKGIRYLVRELKNEFCDRNYHLNLEGCS